MTATVSAEDIVIRETMCPKLGYMPGLEIEGK